MLGAQPSADRDDEPLRVPAPENAGEVVNDADAREEYFALAEDRDLNRLRGKGEYYRSERTRNWFSWSGLAILTLAVVLVGCALVSIAYHMMTPYSYHFLSSEQVADLKGFLFSGGVGAFIAKYFERIVF